MNKQLWDLYKNSDRGKEVIDLFSFYKKDSLVKEYAEKIRKIAQEFSGYDDENDLNYFEDFEFLISYNIDYLGLFKSEKKDYEDFFNRFSDKFELLDLDEVSEGVFEISENSQTLIKRGDYRSIASMIDIISLVLYAFDDSFYPVLNRERFDLFTKNCDILGIEIPDIPNDRDKKRKLFYYFEICEKIDEFAKTNNLNNEETCACLYDFATLFYEKERVLEMPEPTNIWFTGAANADYKTTLQNLTEDTVAVWSCNEETKRGDIVVLYCLSPQSFIHSIWIANSDGVTNPFNYWSGRTTVTKPIVIAPISYKELKEDEYWSNVPIVRKNLQGIKGVRLSAQDYDELQRLLKSKGFDTSVLPKLYKPNIDLERNIKNEKDVEEKLLIPLLKQLGYSEDDWTRQLSQKAGRNLKAIPDFVFFPTGELHFQNAPLVIEAKYFMNSSREKNNSFNQALSYAKMMSADVLCLCDKERLIVYERKNGNFDRFNPVFEKHWGKILEESVFAELKNILGKERIKSLN